MKTFALLVAAALATAIAHSAEAPSFSFKTQLPEFTAPKVRAFELKLGEVTKNKVPPMTFTSPSFNSAPDRFGALSKPASKPVPVIRVVKPRTDVDFKLMVQEPDPGIDPKFVKPFAEEKPGSGLQK